MKRALYPGTFDPFTNGHLDIVQRAVALFDEVIVTVARNSSKKPLFQSDERISMIREATSGIVGVSVDSFDGLLVRYAEERGASVIIRGLRMISDFEYEFQMALMNRKIAEHIATVFLMPDERYTYLSSSIVREIARLGGDCRAFVPGNILKHLEQKYKTGKDPL
jgi:pantetheine-phosphate adenylyltransferase